jgi:hypothetical protein
LARLLILLALLAAALPVRAEAQEPQLRLTAADPDGGRLGKGDVLYLRISYDSAVPLRLQAKGFSGGAEVKTGARYNPAPVYPAGADDAVAWVAYAGPTRLDEIRITAYGADWKPVATLSYPVAAQWSGPGGRRVAAWATALSDRQQAMTSQSMAASQGEDDGYIGLAITAAGLSIPGYLVLQFVLLFRYSGRWRLAAALPLLGMIPLILYTLAALAAGSNLWPLMLIFLTPLAFLYLLAVMVLKQVAAALAPS